MTFRKSEKIIRLRNLTELIEHRQNSLEAITIMSRNYQQPNYHQQQQDMYFPPQQPYGAVYYQQPQYMNQPMYYPQQQMPYYNQGQEQMYYNNPNQGYATGYNQQYYDPGTVEPYQGRGRGRGQGRGGRGGGRGRGYQNQGRHRRFNEDTKQTDLNQDNNSSVNNNNKDSTHEGANAKSDEINKNKPAAESFNDVKDLYNGVDEDGKTFSETVVPEKSNVNTRKGYNNRGGRSYSSSRGGYRSRVSQGNRNQGRKNVNDPVSARERMQERSANQQRAGRGSDDENEAANRKQDGQEEEQSQNATARQRFVAFLPLSNTIEKVCLLMDGETILINK